VLAEWFVSLSGGLVWELLRGGSESGFDGVLLGGRLLCFLAFFCAVVGLGTVSGRRGLVHGEVMGASVIRIGCPEGGGMAVLPVFGLLTLANDRDNAYLRFSFVPVVGWMGAVCFWYLCRQKSIMRRLRSVAWLEVQNDSGQMFRVVGISPLEFQPNKKDRVLVAPMALSDLETGGAA
jgi:hypothetical protein